MTTSNDDGDLETDGRDDWLLEEDENEIYDNWVSDEGYLSTPISVVAEHNFMVFIMMKEYLRYARDSAPDYILALERARRHELRKDNVDPASVASLDRWVAHIHQFIAKYKHEAYYVDEFIKRYPTNNEIAQDTKAQEIFLRFYGGCYFYHESYSMTECGYLDSYFARGSNPIYQFKFEDMDITG
jgi:hypothetical protein